MQVQQQSIQQQSFGYGQMYGQGFGGHSGMITEVGDTDKEKTVVAVVVTIVSGSTYDNLFKAVKQEAPTEDSRVAVYSVSYAMLPHITTRLKKERRPEDNLEEKSIKLLGELFANIQKLDPECVVFNWECCSSCSDSGFQDNSTGTLDLLKVALDMKFMCMFGDFSLKALIKDWKSDVLGPNPFIRRACDISSCMKLEFEPQALKDCPSSQLQKVGELCTEGVVEVNAMGGTIQYEVDWDVAMSSECYSMQVLTRVVSADNKAVEADKKSESEAKPGIAGHVLLQFACGGHLLTSCGHWIELSRLGMTEEDYLKVGEKNYGKAWSDNTRCELAKMGKAKKTSYIQNMASNWVQQSAPCQYQNQMKMPPSKTC